jgi:hypothetical protein
MQDLGSGSKGSEGAEAGTVENETEKRAVGKADQRKRLITSSYSQKHFFLRRRGEENLGAMIETTDKYLWRTMWLEGSQVVGQIEMSSLKQETAYGY